MLRFNSYKIQEPRKSNFFGLTLSFSKGAKYTLRDLEIPMSCLNNDIKRTKKTKR